MAAPKQAASRKRRFSDAKTHTKRPGFDAFATPAIITKRKKVVAYAKPESPEAGIHSFAWASSIKLQKQMGFLQLPYELRLKIYRLAIKDFGCEDTKIEPVKNGKKFKSWNWPHAARDTAVLSETCRQMYVDCIGGGLLYRFQRFRFNSAAAMMNYLWVINPFHKNALRSITLKLHIGAYNWSAPKKCFELLAECKALEHLTLEFSIDRFKCAKVVDQNFPHDYRDHYNWRRVPWNDVEKIEKCEILRGIIQVLSSFYMRFWTEEFDANTGIFTTSRLESYGEKRADCPYRGLKHRLQALIPNN